MLKNKISALARITWNGETKKYMGDSFISLVNLIAFNDITAGYDLAVNAGTMYFHFSTMLFWDKMKRFLEGTFKDGYEQVKMAKKFDHNYENYEKFVKRQIHAIDELDADEKIDYFANLTRALCLTDLDLGMYFKLHRFLKICTVEELVYLENTELDDRFKNSAMVSALYQYGLMTQNENGDGTTAYVLSGFAKALKESSLNFEDLCNKLHYYSFDVVPPLDLPEAIQVDEITALFDEKVSKKLDEI